MARYYANLTQLRSEQKVPATQTADDADLLEKSKFVSARIDAETKKVYEPILDTRTYDAKGEHITDDGRTLFIRYPLLSITSITLGDGTTLSASDYTLLPANSTPKSMIEIKHSKSYRWTQYTTDFEQAISIVGLWCHRREYEDAWTTGSTLAAGLTNSATSATVSSGSLFSAGQLLRITTGGSSEYIRCTAVSGAVLTLTRGVNGTTAIAHDNADTVSIFQPEENIVRAAAKWAGLLYAKRGVNTKVEYNTQTGIAQEYPADVPPEVESILKLYRSKQGFYSVG